MNPIYVVPNGNINTHSVLKEMFERSGVSQRSFALRMGLQEGTFSKYLAGKLKPPKVVAYAAVFAAMCFGVAMRIQQPGEQLTGGVKLPKS